MKQPRKIVSVLSLNEYRSRNEDAPLDLVRESDSWQPVVRLIDAWAKEKLGPTSGYSSQDLDCISQSRGLRFHAVVREWWRLAGRHPFVEPGLLPDNAMFLRPHDADLISHPGFFPIVLDDIQTWSGNGIHSDFLSEADPQVHGINGTIGPDHDPNLNWYRGLFIATGLRVPALIYTTLLWHLFEPSPLVLDQTVYLKVERRGLRGGQPDAKLISQLKLRCFPNDTIVGDIYSDGQDIIYWWLRGCACRTAEAAERVHQVVPAHARGRND